MTWHIDMPPAKWFTKDSEGLDGLVREIQDTKLVAIDTETTGLHKMADRVLYWSLAWTDSSGREHRCCLRNDTLPAFRKVFADPYRTWIFANAKFDLHLLTSSGFPLIGRAADTAVMHALLYEDESHGLKDMCLQILGWTWQSFQDTFGKVNKKDPSDSYQHRLIKAEKEDLWKLVEYASNDAYGTLMLYYELKRQLEAASTWSAYPQTYATLWDLFEKTEMPYTRVLWSCERTGMQVDTDYLGSIGDKIDGQIATHLRELAKAAGRLVNPKGDDVENLLFKELKLRPAKWTKGGVSSAPKPSVAKDALQEMAEAAKDPKAQSILRALLGYGEVIALKTNFIPGLLRGLDPTGRIHASFNQSVAVTGRLSSSDPNMQNLRNPERDPFALRKAIRAAKGNLLIAADYEALEMMVLAAAACEEGMLEIFRRGWDIHKGNASMVFGYPYEDLERATRIKEEVKAKVLPPTELTDYLKKCLEARTAVKTISYGLNYGMKSQKLAFSLGITVEAAEELMAKYMARWSAVQAFFASTQSTLEQSGYIYTFLGRRRYLPAIASPNPYERWRAGRQGANAIIQGTAAEIAKCSMLRLAHEGLLNEWGWCMLSQIHDEILFEGPEETADMAIPIITDAMENPFQTRYAAPLRTKPAKGATWYDAK